MDTMLTMNNVEDVEEDQEYSEILKWKYVDIGNEQEDVPRRIGRHTRTKKISLTLVAL